MYPQREDRYYEMEAGGFFFFRGLSISFAWGFLVCIVLHRRPDGAIHLL